MRTITSPGIQFFETDKSNYGTTQSVDDTYQTVLISGFSSKGQDHTPRYVYSIDEFTSNFGEPTTIAEKYFYNAVEETLANSNNTPVRVLAVKLPYDNPANSIFPCVNYAIDDSPIPLSDIHSIVKARNTTYSQNTNTIENLLVYKNNTRGFNSISAELKSDVEDFLYPQNRSDRISFDNTFFTWLRQTVGIDHSLLDTYNNLFSKNLDAFKNLNQIFIDYENVSLDDSSPNNNIANPGRYITTKDIRTAVGGLTNSLGSNLNTVEKIASFAYIFASRIESLGNDGTNDTPSTIVNLQEETIRNTKRIHDKLIFAGFTSFIDVIIKFFNSISMNDILNFCVEFDNAYNEIETSNNVKTFLAGIVLKANDTLKRNIEGANYLSEVRSTFSNITSAYGITNNNLDLAYKNQISLDELDQLLLGMTSINIPENTIKIVDKTRSKFDKDTTGSFSFIPGEESNEFIGIVPVITTVINALYYKNLLNNAPDYISANNNPYAPIYSFNKTITNNINTQLPSDFFSHAVQNKLWAIPLRSNDRNVESIGKIASRDFCYPNITSMSNDNTLDSEYLKQIGVVVFKMIRDASSNNKILLTPVESFVGSLERNSKNQYDYRKSAFIDDIINTNSNYIYFFSNFKPAYDYSSFHVYEQIATSMGLHEADCEPIISVEKSILNAFDSIVLDKLSNTRDYPIDIVLDAGVSDICHYIGMNTTSGSGKYEPNSDYYETNINRSPAISGNSFSKYWQQVINKYNDFCKNIRKDCMFIADAPRSLTLEGALPIIRNSKPTNNSKNSILQKFKSLTNIKTSYGAGYISWLSVVDKFTSLLMWIPPSVKVVSCYLKGNPWEAPAGLNRGRLENIAEVSFIPNRDDANFIYENNWNYISSYPIDGVVVEGQKTFQKNKTAFDRINVRRLFLHLEKTVSDIARGILYENITPQELTRISARIQSKINSIKNRNGIIDFKVVCNSTNNTAETIDNNEVHIAIGIKPAKTAEFIILNFVCTSQTIEVIEAL